MRDGDRTGMRGQDNVGLGGDRMVDDGGRDSSNKRGDLGRAPFAFLALSWCDPLISSHPAARVAGGDTHLQK